MGADPIRAACATVACVAGALVAWVMVVTATPQEPSRGMLSLDPPQPRMGDVVLVTWTAPAGVTGVRVEVFDRPHTAFPVGGGQWQALVGVDLDQRPGRYPVRVTVSPTLLAGDETVPRADVVVRRRTFPVRSLRVEPAFVNPPVEEQQRIDRDRALTRAAYAASSAERLWSEPFVRPVPQAANSAFGSRSVFNGERRSPHTGTDFLSPTGTPVHAPNRGRVVIARDLYFTGGTVLIDHGLGVFSLLAHLSRIDVREDASVARDEVVGLVGATGRVTGPHLHWALAVAGARVDPLSLLARVGGAAP